MATNTKIAIVTGANKGIGYEIVKGLCKDYNGLVYLTSRNVGRGQEAVKKLNDIGLTPLYHQLDITDKNSIKKFKEYIKEKHGGIDLLVNNAGIMSQDGSVVKRAQDTIHVNYNCLKTVCNQLFPLLKSNARVVNVSSGAGHLSNIKSQEIRNHFADKQLTVSKLDSLMNEYLNLLKSGRSPSGQWTSPYFLSKVAVCALTRLQQKEADAEIPNRSLHINSVHPGYVQTDLTGNSGFLTPEEGARAPLFVCLTTKELKGEFIWRDCTICDWTAAKQPTPW